MKKLCLSVVMFLLALGVSFAQEIPTGPWQVEPSYPEFREDSGWGHWEVRDIKVIWDDDSELLVYHGMDGGITNMVFHTVMGGKDTAFSSSPREGAREENFTALEQWKKFAEQARTRCRFLTKYAYVELEAYECLGKSRVLRGWEFGRGQEHFVFKDGDRLAVVSLDNWKGTEPQKGEHVLLGRHIALEVFFPVTRIGDKFLIEPQAAEAIAQREREREEALAEPKEAPVPTLPTIVVEGRLPDKEK